MYRCYRFCCIIVTIFVVLLFPFSLHCDYRFCCISNFLLHVLLYFLRACCSLLLTHRKRNRCIFPVKEVTRLSCGTSSVPQDEKVVNGPKFLSLQTGSSRVSDSSQSHLLGCDKLRSIHDVPNRSFYF